MHFGAIDGLRAWLAWAVVAAHITLFCNIEASNKLTLAISNLGSPAVLVFIVISGFVICNRIIQLHEPWWPYIIRRFFRIFPLYWLLLLVTVVLAPYAASAYGMMPWASYPEGGSQLRFQEWSQATTDHPVAQWLLHIGLLQGVVPDILWPFTSSNMLAPAWSLSLEWQYYLVAPAFVWTLANRNTAALTVLGVMGLAVLFNRAGGYYQPSFLPIAGYIFMVGIASRLGFEQLQKTSLPSVVVIAILFFGLMFKELRWLAVWAAVLVYLLNERYWTDDLIGRLMSMALASKPAIYFGERSYSTYLVHFPIMCALLIALAPLELSKGTAIVVFATSAIALTVVASHLLYRYIEQPFIRFGSRIARRQIVVAPAE